MNTQLKIDWNKDNEDNARYSVCDGVCSHYVSEEQMAIEGDKIAAMYDVAEAFTRGYDHAGTDDIFAICRIEDLVDGEAHSFAFDGHGNFEWDTRRQG